MISALGRQCHVSLVEMKYIFPIRAVGYVLGAVVGGIVFDKYSGAKLLTLSSLGISFFQFIAGLSHKMISLSISFFFVGVFAGMLDTGTNTLLVWIWGDEVAPYMSTMHFFFGCGAFISPLVTAAVLELANGNIQIALFIQSALCIPIAILFYITKSPNHPTSYNITKEQVINDIGQEKTDQKITIVQDIEPLIESIVSSSDGQTNEETNEDGLKTTAIQTKDKREEVESELSLLIAIFVSVFLALAVGTEVSFGGWISTYTMNTLSTSESVGAYITSVFWGAFTFGRLVSIPISTRLSPPLYLFLDLVIGIVGTLVLLLSKNNMLSLCSGDWLILLPQCFQTVFLCQHH